MTASASTVRPSETAKASGGATVRHGAVTAVVCLALATVVAAMSSLNVAIPDIARATRASQTQLTWVIDAYSLTFAALLLPGGALGDRFGRRRLLVIGLLVFGAGSAVAMTASSAGELIALRALIGLGAALVMPATLSTITGTFPPAQRTKAVSVWAAVAGVAAIVGVLCSGTLLELFSWESVFGLNVVLAALALIGVLLVVPESADKDAPRLDVGGAVLAFLGLLSLVYSIIQAPTVGWLAFRTLIGFAASAILFAGFVAFELRRQHPMLDPRVFTQRGLRAGTISVSAQFFAFFGFIFLILQYLQIVRGHSALVGAVYLLPMAITMVPTTRLSPRLAAKLGTRTVCVGGLLTMAVAFIVLARVDATSSDWLLTGGLLLLGLGMGATMTPATSAITSALPSRQQGVASAVNDMAREVGGAIGIAVIGSISTAIYRSHLSLPGLPSHVVDQVRASIGVAAHLGGPVAEHANLAFVDGIHIALLAAAAAVGLAAIVVAFVAPRRSSKTSRGGEDDLVRTGAQVADPAECWRERT